MFKEFYWKKVNEYSFGDGKNTTVEPVGVKVPGAEKIKTFFTVYGRAFDGLSRALIDTPDIQDAKALTAYFNNLVQKSEGVKL